MGSLASWAVGIPVSLLLANWLEWFVHKHLLHGPGKRKGSFWNFHWTQHHTEARRRGMPDPDYESGSLLEWNSRTKELAALSLGPALWIPLVFLSHGVARAVASGLLFSTAVYVHRHRRAHRDPAWARKHVPWHVDHHLGPNPDANWGVSWPWFDWILGTREKYVGTPSEDASLAAPPG